VGPARTAVWYELAMRPRRPLVAILVALALLGAVSCGGSNDSEDGAEPTATTDAGSPATTGAGGRVTVEDAGREPRQRLQLRLAEGSTTRAAMVSKVELDMNIEGNRLSAGALPTTRAVIEQRIDRVDPDGTAHYTVTIGDWSVEATPGVDEAVADQTERALAQLEGLRGTGTIDPSGSTQSVRMDTSTVQDPIMKSTLDSFSSQVTNLAAPFPSEPVGPGARWRATSSATINGITMNTTSTYTLRSRTGDHYELDVVQEAEAPSGRVEIPNLPAGTETSIESFTVRSTGRIAGELTKPLPSNSTVQGGGEGRLTVVAQGNRGTLFERIKIDVALSPA
jgi:hypothetical protein